MGGGEVVGGGHDYVDRENIKGNDLRWRIEKWSGRWRNPRLWFVVFVSHFPLDQRDTTSIHQIFFSPPYNIQWASSTTNLSASGFKKYFSIQSAGLRSRFYPGWRNRVGHPVPPRTRYRVVCPILSPRKNRDIVPILEYFDLFLFVCKIHTNFISILTMRFSWHF